MFRLEHDTTIPDLVHLKPGRIAQDSRGIFMETFRANLLSEFLEQPIEFPQGYLCVASPYTMRGLYYQERNPQGLLVRCVAGAIYDVVVDMRHNSPTFGKWSANHLTEENLNALYIPPGMAHGFMTRDQGATICYNATTYFDAAWDRTLLWNDPTLAILWPAGPNTPLLISAKDKAGLRWAELAPPQDVAA